MGFVGSIEPRKRPDRFIEGVAALANALPDQDVRGLLFGGPKDDAGRRFQRALLDRYRDLIDAGTVSFCGKAEAAEIAAKVDLLYCPFQNEPLGRVVPEFVYAGVRVIAMAAGGIPEAAAEAEDWVALIPEGDDASVEQAFVDNAVGVLRSSPPTAQQLQDVRRRLEAQFGASTVVNREQAVYRDLLGLTD